MMTILLYLQEYLQQTEEMCTQNLMFYHDGVSPLHVSLYTRQAVPGHAVLNK